jgi:hypothetical protein
MSDTATTLAYLWPSTGVSYAGDRRHEIIEPRRILPRDGNAATNQNADAGFDHHHVKLKVLGKDRSLVPEGAATPTPSTQALASVMLQQLQANRIVPTRIVASAEGGIAICFMNGDKYADVEFLNSGEILGVVSNRRDKPTVWDIHPSSREFMGAALKIFQFLHTPSTSEDAPKRAWRR